MMVFDRNVRDVSELKWPTTTTGMFGLEQGRRAAGVHHVHDVGALAEPEVGAGGRRADGAGHDVALEPERRRAELCPVRRAPG